MWYAIGAAGLVAVGILIWALIERSMRHSRETDLEVARGAVKEREGRLLAASGAISGLQDELAREKAHTAGLRAALEQAQQRLLACDDPVTVRKWIEDELKGEKL